MANLLPFLVMTPVEAARFRDMTKDESNKVDPILVRAGPYNGKYVLPARVKADPALQSHWDAFAMCDEIALDTQVAFPPIEEE